MFSDIFAFFISQNFGINESARKWILFSLQSLFQMNEYSTQKRLDKNEQSIFNECE